MYIGTPGYSDRPSSTTVEIVYNDMTHSYLSPLVGRYILMCMDGLSPGLSRRGRTVEDVVGRMVT